MDDQNNNSFDLDNEDTYEYPNEKYSFYSIFSRYRILFLLCSVFVICFFISIVALSITLPIFLINNSDNSSNKSSFESSFELSSSYDEHFSNNYNDNYITEYFDTRIKNTTESQIDIRDPSIWDDRETQIQLMIEFMNENSYYLNTSYSSISETSRIQKLFNVNNCGLKTEFRLREMVDGDGMGDSYIDVKGNSHDMYEACTNPFDSALMYQYNSSQKCELDYHECTDDDKYSRETRIFFKNYVPSFEKCSDLMALYPGAFKDIDNSYYDGIVSIRSLTNWWARKYSGILDNDTKYEITFTLTYAAIEDAINGSAAPFAGEWSIRLYSLGEGFTDKWNTDVVNDIDIMYHQFMQEFGRPGYCDK